MAGTKPGHDTLRGHASPTQKDTMVARIIALEEHFWTPQLIALRRTADQVNPKSVERLGDLGALRLREMDEAGIDVQVLSEAEPGVQNLTPEQAVPLARASNDLLFEAVKRNPGRFAGFATLPTPDPAAAARELERTVQELRFCGAMVHGSTRGHFLDDRRFRPILEAAAALDVPIYLHPCTPQPAVLDTYFKDYPQLSRAALGFGIEMAVQAARRANLRRSFREYFRDNFFVTTSGNFSHPALQCAIAELGVERILFAVDWPFQRNSEAVDFIKRAEVTAADREQIFGTSARRLLRI
jgi:predicted TIM-barrel fold metal-dependent hydrolase